MNTLTDAEKLTFIYRLLFAMATGKKSVLEDARDYSLLDEYGDILRSLLEIANRLEGLVLKQGIVPPYYSFQNITQLVFVLDSQFKLQNYNEDVLNVLKYSPEALYSIRFENLLETKSQEVWNQSIATFSSFVATELIFVTPDHYLHPLFCSISRLHFDNRTLIVSLSAIPEQDDYLNFRSHTVASKLADEVILLEKLHAYILAHLDAPLPSLKQLAKLFRTEAHVLKTGFKRHYHTSIYQFYHEQRLHKAHSYIRETNILLKEIAYLCGFSTYMNFYKAFKKYFGYAPSALHRLYLDSID